jgi:protocatechuate 3,4-dioxygenase beta subunit
MTHAHDLGLAHDLQQLIALERRAARFMDRRGALRLIGAASIVALAACGSDSKKSATGTSTSSSSSSSSSSSTSTSQATSTSATAAAGGTGMTTPASVSQCGETIPTETGGPFPGDGTNGPNALTQSGVVRSDIRNSFGSASGVAQGVPLKVNLTILQKSTGCKAYPGAAVYVWHCDREGRYSMYSQGVTEQNYLRGVQQVDANGRVSFTSIFPAAYSGRYPHIHFEIFSSLANATSAGSKIKTTQLALPEDACKAVYATAGYEQSQTNMARTSLATDNVYGDGASHQVASASGSPTAGYTAELTVTV